MVRQRRLGVLVSLALIVVSVSMPRHAIADGGVSADLSGVPIGIEDIARYHCHDLDYPRMRCFETVDALVLELERRLSAGPGFGRASDSPLGTLAVNLFRGARYDFCCNVQVAWIGSAWNDRISSAEVL